MVRPDWFVDRSCPVTYTVDKEQYVLIPVGLGAQARECGNPAKVRLEKECTVQAD